MSGADRPLIVSVGKVGLNFYGVVPRMPNTGRPVEMEEISLQIGGSAAIAAGASAALGCHTRLVCKLADDLLEQFIIRGMHDAGIEPCGVLDKDSRLSPMVFTAMGKNSGSQRVFYSDGDAGELSADDVDPNVVLDGASALLLDGHDAQAQESLAEAARKKSIPVIVDATIMREGTGTLASLSDVLICSERLAAELAPRDSLQESLVEIARLGPRAVIITLGDAGAVGLLGDQMVQQSVFDVDLVDASGAGSVFHGAFATAMVGELPFAKCIELATAAASLACRRLGSWAGIPLRDEVLRLLRS